MTACYSFELKQKAIDLLTLERKSMAQLSLELGLSKGTLYYCLNWQISGSMALRIGGPSMDPAHEIKRLRAQNEAMKKENLRLGSERNETKEENRAAKLVIEYLRTQNL